MAVVSYNAKPIVFQSVKVSSSTDLTDLNTILIESPYDLHASDVGDSENFVIYGDGVHSATATDGTYAILQYGINVVVRQTGPGGSIGPDPVGGANLSPPTVVLWQGIWFLEDTTLAEIFDTV